MSDQPNLFVLVDDKRECAEDGTIIVRDPRVAFDVLCRLSPIHTLAMDNDMGHGWEFEGRNILKKYLSACEPWLGSGQALIGPNPSYPVHVVLVTSNEPAAKSMRDLLREHGYMPLSTTEFVRP
jgi:hypothetical protein